MIIWNRHYHCPHFTDEKTEAQSAKDAQLENGRGKFWTRQKCESSLLICKNVKIVYIIITKEWLYCMQNEMHLDNLTFG